MSSKQNIGNQRFCLQCRTLKPFGEFTEHSQGGYSELCKPCQKNRKTGIYEDALRKASRDLAGEVTRGLSAGRLEVPHTSELAASIVQKHGGLDGIADFIVTQGKACAEEKPGSRAALDYCKLLTVLISKSTEQRETAPDVANLSPEELEQQLQAYLREIVAAHPEMVSQVLETTHRRIDKEESSDGQEED